MITNASSSRRRRQPSAWIKINDRLCFGHERQLPRRPAGRRPRKAPSLAEFEVIAIEAFRRLPAHFRAKCDGVVIQVEDDPTDEVLDGMGIASELELLGLFQGVGVPFQSESAPQQMPNMVWLYRVPILLYWAEHDEALGAIITHVLVHEIGIISDCRMTTWMKSNEPRINKETS